MLSDADIEEAKFRTKYSQEAHHEHNDCIRMAYQWLDAQNNVKLAARRWRPLKHIIEKWAGRYISQTDVEVAAVLHPKITGRYPDFNLSTRLVMPNDRRLQGLGEALSQGYRDRLEPGTYKIIEP